MRRFLLLAPFALLAACSQRAERGPFPLRIAVTGPLLSVDPAHPFGNATLAMDLAFTGVLYPDEAGRPRSRVAREVERLGPTRYRIALDPAARFSDGSPVTFDDVARAVAPWKVAAARDGDRIVLESPGGAIEARLFYSTVARESGGRWIGTGPFRVVEEGPWRIALERVQPARGRLNRVELVAFPTTRDALARTLRGEANGVTGLSDRQVEFLEGVPALKVTSAPAPVVRAIAFNHERLKPAEWRALKVGLPLRQIAAFGCSRPDLVNPSLPAAAAEIPPGRLLSIVNSLPDTATSPLALALRRALGSRGGSLARADPAAPNPQRQAADHDLVVRTVFAWPPVVLALNWATGAPFNATGYSNPAVDAAFARGDPDAAAAEIERTAPYVALCRVERIGAFDARIRSPTFGWWGILDTLPDWEVAP